jgi:hypothetical protein
VSLTSKIDESFERTWRAEILKSRPLILPRRQFTYPGVAEEVERGALEVMVTPANSEAFLATCALGFRDPAAAMGIWSTPHPDWLSALSGGYAYLIDSKNPEKFAMLELRPVLSVHAAVAAGLLVFVGNRKIIAWGREELRWESDNLSDEGVTVVRIDAETLYGRGWEMMRDREYGFELDLVTGRHRCN